MSDYEDHDHDDDDEIESMSVPGPPAETLHRFDFVGIALLTIGNTIGAIANGFGMASQEFFSAARLGRQREETERQRREAGFELERIIEGEDHHG